MMRKSMFVIFAAATVVGLWFAVPKEILTSKDEVAVKTTVAEGGKDSHSFGAFSTIDHMCLVHLGKAAGSTVTCMLSPTVQNSGVGNSGCNARVGNETSETAAEGTALYRAVVARVHLRPTPVEDDRYDSFLITLRNPIDRIVSWYYYLHPDYPPEKLEHHKRGCQNFAFFNCWPTLRGFVSIGLSSNRTTSSHVHSLNQTREECDAWAWDAATGTRDCWHNFWNYNRTYGPLLERRHRDNNTANDRQVVFAIRSEHLLEDWNRIDYLLGGAADLPEEMALPHKNNFSSFHHHATDDDKIAKTDALDHLCTALCDEMQIYKRLLRLAVNINANDERQSIAELAHICPDENLDIRDCHM